MKEDSVERLFLASLRQALEDIAPEQLEVFQKWFDPADRRPRFHIAPVMAAVSYLSRDPALYEKVMDRAGRYASDWSYEHLSPVERKLWSSLPLAGRERAVKRLLRAGLKTSIAMVGSKLDGKGPSSSSSSQISFFAEPSLVMDRSASTMPRCSKD